MSRANPTKNDNARHGDMTPAKANALIDALLFGSIWSIGRGSDRYCAGDRHHHAVTINRLKNAGLLEYKSTQDRHYAGGWVLTKRGRAVAGSLDDTESSASRQHFVDTGAYLTFGDREGLNPADFAKGDVVRYKLDLSEKQYRVEAVRWIPDGGYHEYDLVLIDGQENVPFLAMRYHDIRLSKTTYELVEPEPKVNWEMLAPKVAEAAVLVAIGRGDERVQMYADSGLDEVYDGDIMALNLLKQLMEAGR